MKQSRLTQSISYIKTPQRALALLFLLLFPWSTVFIYNERFIHGYKWEYGTLAYYGIELLGWLFLCSVFFPLIKKMWKHHKHIQFQMTPDRLFFASLFVFVLYSVVSGLWAIDSVLALQQTTRMLLMCLLCVSLPLVLKKQEIILAFSLGAILPMGIGIYQFFAQELFSSVWLGISGRAVSDAGVSVVQSGSNRWLRAYGTFAHPNIFGGYVAVLIMSVFVGLRQSFHPRVRLWYFGILLLSGITLILTMSRSAWIAVFLGIGTVFGVFWRRMALPQQHAVKTGLGALGLGMLCACLLTLPLLSVRFTGTAPHEITSITERVELQVQGIDLWRQHPFFGVGAANMTAAVIAHDATQPGYAYQPVHNIFLLLAVEYGAIGILFFGMAVFLCIRWIGVQGGARIYFVAMGVLLPLAFFDHYLWTSVHGLGIASVYLAILLYPNNSSREQYPMISIDE